MLPSLNTSASPSAPSSHPLGAVSIARHAEECHLTFSGAEWATILRKLRLRAAGSVEGSQRNERQK